MFDALRRCEEWLVFGWGGRRFGAPNARGHLIEMASVLYPDPRGDAAASYLHRGTSRPVHCLDGDLRFTEMGGQAGVAIEIGDRPFFVFFGGSPHPFGLLCEQADILQVKEQGLRLHELPPALRRPESPLLGVALPREAGEPILLSTPEALHAYLTRIDPPTGLGRAVAGKSP